MEKANGSLKVVLTSSLDDMPAELLAKIFACLPVHIILQLRSVCKLWNHIITTPSTFPTIWSKHAPSFPPWIIMYSSRESIAAFNPSSSIWLTLPIPCPAGFTFQKRILASCGGLICFCAACACDSCRILLVCNPITKEFKLLPEIPFCADDDLHAEMVMEEASSPYRIFIAEAIVDKDSLLEGGPQAAFYNSVDEMWHPMDAKDLPFLEGYQGDNVFHARTFFSVSKVGPPHQLTMYNPKDQEATLLRLPFESSMTLFPPLSACRGQLFLAGGNWGHIPFFNIWELDHFTNKFEQIDRMACAYLDDRHILPLPVSTLQRFGSGDILFFHATMLHCPLVYDVKEKYWLCMPRYYGPCKSWVPSIMYEPSFLARV